MVKTSEGIDLCDDALQVADEVKRQKTHTLCLLSPKTWKILMCVIALLEERLDE
eukprot:m.13584 g.13584  ORF g.13584 m.13584 type:complete len:54 (-) comp7546_c0_seq2:257-418(-)